MDMLSNSGLLKSDVVANSTMNRQRGLTGVNSYERELGLDIVPWLLDRTSLCGAALWYDACCGEGLALAQARPQLIGVRGGQNVSMVGVDLVGSIGNERRQDVLVGDVATFAPSQPADLITCVHGVHYIGDKLGLIEHWYTLLAPGGLMSCNVDLANIRIDGTAVASWSALAKRAAPVNQHTKYHKHILTIQKIPDTSLDFGLEYIGATVSETPNYTGITVIDSWYAARGQ